jgi:AraC-like DNA-binding protein
MEPRVWHAPVAPTDAVSILLDRLRWTVTGLARHEIRPGGGQRFQGSEMRFHHVVSGEATVSAPTGTIRMDTSDVVLALRGGEYVVRADTTTVLLSAMMDPVGGHDLVAGRLPLFLLSCGFIGKEPLAAALLERMETELTAARVGATSVVSQLANVIASTALRSWVEGGCDVEGWHRAATDADITRVAAAISDDPGHPWTVERLARIAHSSRSMFAARFRLVVGESPARYVLRMRMERAKQLLAQDRSSVAQTAVTLGYGSEAAFSRAFRRVVGLPPSAWRHSAWRQTGRASGAPDVRPGEAPRG